MMASELPIDRIICGDNVEVMATFPDACIDLVVTSPPYDNLRKYGGHTWDFEGVAQQLWRIIKPGGVVVWVVADATVNGSETGTSFRQALRFMGIGFRLYDTMIYQTSKPPMNDRRYQSEFEFMFVFSRNKPKAWNPIKLPTKHAGERVSGTYWNVDGTQKPRHGDGRPVDDYFVRGNVWRMVDRQGNGHPATFPEDLARDHILSWSNEGDIVLDPFNGSGTTTKMARLMGRRFIGIDVNERYCEIAHKRLAQGLLFQEATC